MLACDEEIQVTAPGYTASGITMQWIQNIKRYS